jgi:RecB family exonuclease
MLLPENFRFSQSSLQDFVDCPRRFYLRYIRQLRYPAPESAHLHAFEQQVERGARFHRLVHQHQLGIPAQALETTITDDTLAAWWAAYLEHAPADLPERRASEITLSASLAGRRLVARYDLLAIGADRAVIVDWKTTPARPKRSLLARRLQTVVYPYLLTQAGAHLNGGKPIPPEAISMVYWFPAFPDKPEVFNYSAKQFAADSVRLEAIAADILSRTTEEAFELTDDLERCLFCAFRSLNGRGAQAGDRLSSALDDDFERASFELDLHLDQIGEAGF